MNRDTFHLSKEYRDYIDSPAWCLKRAEKIVEVGSDCQLCGVKQTPSQAHAHHLTYANLGNEHLDDLMVLCHKCHDAMHVDPNGFVSVTRERLAWFCHYLRNVAGMQEEMESAWQREVAVLRARLAEIDPAALESDETKYAKQMEERRNVLRSQLNAAEVEVGDLTIPRSRLTSARKWGIA